MLNCAFTLYQLFLTMSQPKEMVRVIWPPVNGVIAPLLPLIATTSREPQDTSECKEVKVGMRD